MAFRFRRSIRPGGDGTLEVHLGAAERALLAEVARELGRELDEPDDPSLQRLFPPGYADDAVREAGYQMMMGDQLRRRHLDAALLLAASADADRLDAEQAEAWLRSINAVRLVLGTRLGITDDSAPVRVSRHDPDLRAWVAYDFLSVLLDDLIAAMAI